MLRLKPLGSKSDSFSWMALYGRFFNEINWMFSVVAVPFTCKVIAVKIKRNILAHVCVSIAWLATKMTVNVLVTKMVSRGLNRIQARIDLDN